MFEELLEAMKRMDGLEIQISATGRYPTKRQTRVQDVAVYQNDGTDTIEASNFVERAAEHADDWDSEVEQAIDKTIDGDTKAMDRLGETVSRAINDMCDRIDTRRLKHSFRHVIKR